MVRTTRTIYPICLVGTIMVIASVCDLDAATLSFLNLWIKVMLMIVLIVDLAHALKLDLTGKD